ncbi:MAG: phosphoglycerate dehydrogenase [Anaerolineales bacterium]|nr:phosphoglycerate dehydrogenase [Anaerolineales bacterium]
MSNDYTILVTAPYLIPFMDRFHHVFEGAGIEVLIPDVEERMEADDLMPYAGQIDGTICGDDRYTSAVIEAFSPRLKVISKWGTGIDSIDQEAARAFGVAVRNTPGAFTDPVSDTVLGYVLAFARRSPWLDREMKAGRWEKIPGMALNESRLGVVGVGKIGKAVLRKAFSFGVELFGNDIVEIDSHFVHDTGVKMTTLEELLESCDFISINCDLNPTSHHLINAAALKHVQPHAVLINTSRGPVVEESALIAALQEGRLGGAALDVFEFEPLSADSPLRSMDQVMLAPHNSNSSPRAWERVHWNTIGNLFSELGLVPPKPGDK